VDVTLVLDGDHLLVPEGGTASLTFRLSAAPDAALNLQLSFDGSRAPGLTFSGNSAFVLDASNWNTPQAIPFRAAEDANTEDEVGSLVLALDGQRPVTVNIVDGDNDVPTGDGVKLTVKDASGAGATSFPVTAVVPLEYGKHQDATRFYVTDAGGTAVPAQIRALNRWWARDNSIRHAVVRFQATVVPNGQSFYFFKTGAAPASPAKAVTVQDSAAQIVVDTGAIRFTIKKSGFNLFDEVLLDQNGNGTYEASERIVAPGASEGAVFTGRLPGDIQNPKNRTDLRFVVEESGPMEAVVRVSGNSFLLDYDADRAAAGGLLKTLVSAGFPVVGFQVVETNLEDVFMAITKGEVQ
jgi:hypothetical protein